MTIDLSTLTAPELVETLSFEAILAELKTDYVARYPAGAATIDLESDPAVKLLEVAAVRELNLRARINDAARGLMLAYATGSNLEQLAALLGVSRMVTDPGNPDATPPIAPTLETDTSLRARTQLALEGLSTAGPVGAYRFHALSASGDVADVSITSPMPGCVRISVLSNDGNGSPSPELLATVEAAVNADDIRPLTDLVIVTPAVIVEYEIEAILTTYPGPSSAAVLSAAQTAIATHVASLRKLGYDITRSGLFAALHQPGVQNVNLISPAADIACSQLQAGYCTGINISIAGSHV